MLLGARQFFERRGTPPLPYDAEVEYLETDGACYIDTGVYLRTPLKVECDYYLPERGGGSIWGAYRQSSINCRYVNSTASTRRQATYIYNGTSISLSTTSQTPYFPYRATCVAEADAGAQSVSAFGETATGTNANGLTDTLNCTCGVFGNGRTNYSAGETYSSAGTRIYSWKCWIGSDIVANMIPVRFTNEQGVSEGAMYDRANPTVGMNPDGSPRTDGLYRNRGTGAFTWAEKQ